MKTTHSITRFNQVTHPTEKHVQNTLNHVHEFVLGELYQSLLLVKNNRDRLRSRILLKKQIGVNRDGPNQSTKTHFDSSVKVFKRKRKLRRFRDLQITSKLKAKYIR